MSRQPPGDLEKANDICRVDLKGHKNLGKVDRDRLGACPTFLKADLCDLLFAFPSSASRWKVKDSHVVEGRCVL
jgi:hypothetical protein